MVLGAVLVWYIQVRSLENKVESLQKIVDNQDTLIVQLGQDLESTRFELQTVKNGLSVLEDFTSKQKEIQKDADQTKSKIFETVYQSDETRDWWSSEVPSDLLNAFMCQ